MMKIAITEDDYPRIKMKVCAKNVEGRDVFGFFLKQEEFERVKSHLTSNGALEPLDWVTPWLYMLENPHNNATEDREFRKNIKKGNYIFGSEASIIELLSEYGLPLRRINLIREIVGFW